MGRGGGQQPGSGPGDRGPSALLQGCLALVVGTSGAACQPGLALEAGALLFPLRGPEGAGCALPGLSSPIPGCPALPVGVGAEEGGQALGVGAPTVSWEHLWSGAARNAKPPRDPQYKGTCFIMRNVSLDLNTSERL